MNKDLVILAWGGLGDVLVCTPTFQALKEHDPERKLIVYCPNKPKYELLKHNPFIDSLRMLGIQYLWRYPSHLYAYLFNRRKVPYVPLVYHHISPYIYRNKHVKEIVPEIFNIKLNPKHTNVQLYFTSAEEEKAKAALSVFKIPVLIHVHSIASVNHMWDLQNWVQLLSQLPEYTFIQIGHPSETYVPGAVDWRGKTTLREALCLLKYAVSFVGVDSAFAHGTNAFGLPGVVLLGDSSPVVIGHSNNINIYKAVPCAPCYGILGGDECPYNHECMTSISVAEVKVALMQQVAVSLSARPVSADQRR